VFCETNIQKETGKNIKTKKATIGVVAFITDKSVVLFIFLFK